LRPSVCPRFPSSFQKYEYENNEAGSRIQPAIKWE
jgi:hypothetical protein